MNDASADSNPLPLVYACSGCSSAGEIADRIARQLNRAGVAQMSSPAGSKLFILWCPPGGWDFKGNRLHRNGAARSKSKISCRPVTSRMA